MRNQSQVAYQENNQNIIKCPVTPYQERFYIEWRLDPDSAKYNLYFSFRIHGKLNTSCLKTAVQHFLQEYPIFQSSFGQEHETIIQYIHKQPMEDLIELDCCEKKESAVKALIRNYLQKPFDLLSPPLYRFLLIKLSTLDYRLVVIWHHIVGDASLEKPFISKVSQHYNQLLNNKNIKNFDLQSNRHAKNQIEQYITYSQQFRNFTNETAKGYWQETLRDIPLYLDLPKQENITPLDSEISNSYFFSLGEKNNKNFNVFLQRYQTRPFTFLAAIYALALHRYTRQENILINYPMNIRPREQPAMQGCWVNSTILRVDLNSNYSFFALLNEISAKRKIARPHQLLPFIELIKTLRTKEQISDSRQVFNVSLAETYLGLKKLPLAGVDWAVGEGFQPLSIFNELSLGYQFIGDRLHFRLTYLRRLWSNSFAQQFAKHFKRIFNHFLTNPQLRIHEFNLLTAAENKKIIDTWNKTAVSFPRCKTIVQLYEEQVRLTPRKIAIGCGYLSYSYTTINRLANQFGHYLRDAYPSICPLNFSIETKIAICVERNVGMVISLLAILKIGGAYIPIDPAYPPERIKSIIGDSETKLIIVDQTTQEKFSRSNIIPDDSIRIINIDDQKTQALIRRHEDKNLDVAINARNLAYIIYTSGSTGQPKGVLIEHRGIVNHLCWLAGYLAGGLQRTDCSSSFAFDFTVPLIFTPLITGNTLILCPDNIKLSLDAFLNYLEENKITFIKVTPSYLELIAQKKHQFNHLKCILSAGENLPTKICNDILQLNPKLKIYNDYGPTEISVAATAYEYNLAAKVNHYVPIGKPINNAVIFILDKYLNPSPPGVLGELYISGVGVGRGYLNQPELTKEKFIKNPFINNCHDVDRLRMYKTGDLCYWLPDGNVQYIGRIDQQIKIRGYRVEPEEISAKLVQSELVKQAIIIADDMNGKSVLIAYLILAKTLKQKDMGEITQCLKQYLNQSLPSYMVPNYYIALAELPLTTNGKLDKKSLPKFEILREKPSQKAMTEIQTALLSIWQEILRIDEIKLSDNFFYFGCNSLDAIRAVDKIKTMLGIRLFIKDIYRYPTIEELATYLQSQSSQIAQVNYIDYQKELRAINFNCPQKSLPIARTKDKPLQILLTGSTGYLGAHILQYLLANSHCHIYCLLRAKSWSEAQDKLIKAINTYSQWEDKFTHRITIIRGNIAEPLLGLTEDLYQSFAHCLDTIIHAAAHVDHLHSYDFLHKTNVMGMGEIVKLLNYKRAKKLHFISTRGVFGENKTYKSYNELSPIHEEKHLISSGYEGSKWIADLLCQEIRKKEQRCTVYRTSLLIPGQSKVFPPEQWVGQLVLLCNKISAIPTFMEKIVVPVICVDDVAKVIARNALETYPQDNINFHLWSNSSDFFKHLAKAFLKKNHIKLLKTKEWIAHYEAYFAYHPTEKRPVLALIEEIKQVIAENQIHQDSDLLGLLQSKRTFDSQFVQAYSNQMTLANLNRLDIQLTAINDELIDQLINHGCEEIKNV